MTPGEKGLLTLLLHEEPDNIEGTVATRLAREGCHRKQPPGRRGSSVVQTATRLTLIGLALLHEEPDDIRVAVRAHPHQRRPSAVVRRVHIRGRCNGAA